MLCVIALDSNTEGNIRTQCWKVLLQTDLAAFGRSVAGLLSSARRLTVTFSQSLFLQGFLTTQRTAAGDVQRQGLSFAYALCFNSSGCLFLLRSISFLEMNGDSGTCGKSTQRSMPHLWPDAERDETNAPLGVLVHVEIGFPCVIT